MGYRNAIVSVVLGIVITLLTFFFALSCAGGCAPFYNPSANSNNYEGFPFAWFSVGGNTITVPPHYSSTQVYWPYLVLDIVIWSIVVFVAQWAYAKGKAKRK